MAVSRSTPRPRRRTRTWWRRWPTWTPSSPHSARPLAPARPATTITARNRVHPPERLRRFPLLSTRYALRGGGRRQRGGGSVKGLQRQFPREIGYIPLSGCDAPPFSLRATRYGKGDDASAAGRPL